MYDGVQVERNLVYMPLIVYKNLGQKYDFFVSDRNFNKTSVRVEKNELKYDNMMKF